MANLLQVENLTKSFGVNSLFDDINFTINEGDKVGLIAKNGTGKSTLLSIIAGDDTPDDGKLIFKNDVTIGYLKQLPQFEPHLSVMDTCLIGDDEQSKAIRQYENALIEGNNEDMTKAIQAMDLASAWDFEERFKQILSQLKIDDFKQRISELSGGQIKRVALAKILISNPQFLILDEPTNHLDIDMIEWLEAYLTRSRMTILMVTHDRYFLDKICSKILELDQKSIYGYDGNYNYYLEKRAERIDAQNAAVEKARNLLRTEIEWMRRQPQARAHKAQYRIDAFYDLKDRAQSRNDKGDVELNVKAGYIGKKIFVARHVSKSFDGKVILNDFNYIFSRYEKLGIVGDNGVGKSTFIKLLLDRIQPDSGYFEIGETVKFGYYSQEGIHFDEGKKVIDAIRDVAEHIYFDEKHHYSASQFLQLFLFSPTDQQKLIEKLSGGEKRRLYLAMVLMSKPNFLILDEPTNDLDIQTLEILEDYLSKFSGCLIVISHDRFFMDRCVDHTFVFLGDGVIKDFPGNYSEYRAWKEAHEKEEATVQKQKAESKLAKPRSNNRDKSQKLTFKEKREFEELTESIERLTKEKEELFNLFNSGEQINDVATKASRFEEVIDLLDEMELRWLELSEKNS
ncbi:MAG: ABC-F family ATP-binding cassette domain-containing protein [Bacteroidales bacterium]|nr:ABC-F family ATP-binding cassette domain-containing protein [Bacteroidales bacterium]MDY2709999.1 ABC-F family ATP-binding cassette domain-containing protein [Sodaliphilus sp.]